MAAVALASCSGGVEAFPLGEQIEVGHIDSTTSTATTLGLSVLGVRQGTIEELEAVGLQFDPEERELIPHFVDARYANTGGTAVPRTMNVSLEDGSGNLLSSTIIFDFAGERPPEGPCTNINDGELPPGASFEDCTLFLVPAGVEVERVSFLSQRPDEEPDFVYRQAK